ncbi:cupin domain-containing protein [Chloroflexota bacterium]
MTESNYQKYLVTKPIHEGDRKGTGFTNPALAYLTNELVPGCNIFLDYRWFYEMPEPNSIIPEHAHDHDEIVLHIGSDPHNPEDLGGEMEVRVGGESLTFDKTSVLYLPKGTKHGPFTWKNFTRPHLQMAIVLGAGTIATAKPGGRS